MHQTHTAVDTATQVELELANTLEIVEIEDTTQAETITSLELVNQINVFRVNTDNKSELAHSDLLKIIRDEFEEEINAGEFSPVEYTDKKGEKRPMFELTLSQAKQVLVRESKVVRKSVIKYIEELESRVLKPKALPSYSEALRLLADNIEENERLQSENRVMLPKANYFDNIVDKNLLTNISTTAKLLEMKIKTFTQFLLDSKLVFRTASKTKLDKKTGLEKEVIGKLLPHADYCNKEKPNSLYFEVKEFATSGYANTQTMITPRGKEAIILMLGKNR